MAFKIESDEIEYTFPSTFDLQSYDRTTDVPVTVAFGVDGGVTDRRRNRRNQTNLVLSGIIQGNSVASSKATFDDLQEAVSNLGENAYLVDTIEARRIRVNALSINAPRNPARQLNVSVTFQGMDSYWEEITETLATVSNSHWIDLSIGNAPVFPRQVVSGFISHPTLVQGGWNFVTHIDTVNATAINTNASNRPYGKITSAMPSLGNATPTKYGFGRFIGSGATMTFQELACRTDKMSFMVRFRAATTWPTAGDMYLFDFWQPPTNTGTRHYHLLIRRAAGSIWFGNGLNTKFSDLQSIPYISGHDYTVSGWIDTEGQTTAAGSLVKFRLFWGQTMILTKATWVQSAVQTFTKMYVGTARTQGAHAEQVIDEIYVWHESKTDEYLKGLALSQSPVSPTNKVLKSAATLSTASYLEIDHSKKTVRVFDPSVPSYTSKLNTFSGDFFELGKYDEESNKDTIFSLQEITSKLYYRKKYK